ncbi:hypothetical protein GOV12_05305 [Candidatus Pacearchaeota archaeon]|nr:hypothetical protein [Candidatus Pacearchaeota archaeon]
MVNYCLKLIGKGILGAGLIFGILKTGDYVKDCLGSDVRLEYKGEGGRFFNKDSSWGQSDRDDRDFIQRRIDERNELRKNELKRNERKNWNLDDGFDDEIRWDI